MTDTPPTWLRAVQRGHAPNCSSAGSAVGAALVTAVGAAVVLNAYADRFMAWVERRSGDDPPPAGGGDDPPPAGGGDAATGGDHPSGPTDTPRLRWEGDGALLAWPDPPALLHIDAAAANQAVAAGALVVGSASSDRPEGALSAPTEVHLAVTDRCPAACTGCYLSAGPGRKPTEPDDLHQQIDELSDMGVLEVAFGGGEALLRQDLLDLADHARSRDIVPNLTTSGFGLTPALAQAMSSRFGQINVSIDGVDESYAATRGWDGVQLGLRALRTLVEAGARVGVNTVLSGPMLAREGALEAIGAAIAAAGATEWQWLRFKPTGRGATSWEALSATPEQLDALWERSLSLEARTGLTIRWDCAMTPWIADHVDDVQRATLLGVAGCPGGERLWSRHADGRTAPCSFADGAPATEGLAAAWASDPTLLAWRERAANPPAPCDTCTWRDVCRGGCRIVAQHLTGDPASADPQCPRVRAWDPA